MNHNIDVINEHRLYISELRAQLDAANERIAELEAAQRWILVGERLPNDEDEGVIVWTNNGSDYKFFNYDIGFHHEKFGWLLSTEWEHGDPTVTHWMPLPPPPVTPRVASVGANYAPTYRPRLRVALKERIEASGVSVETLIERGLQAMGVEE